jgi:hypothetical protein
MSAEKEIFLGHLSGRFSHSIAKNFTHETVKSVLEKISKNTVPLQHESSVYAPSVDWITSLSNSISNELSKNFNAPPDNFADTSRYVANIVSSIGNGTWSVGVTPVNAIRDLETNLPLYISDYFDKLAAWAREHVFDKEKSRIRSNLNDLGDSSNPYPAESPGPESALSGLYGRNLMIMELNTFKFRYKLIVIIIILCIKRKLAGSFQLLIFIVHSTPTLILQNLVLLVNQVVQ